MTLIIGVSVTCLAADELLLENKAKKNSRKVNKYQMLLRLIRTLMSQPFYTYR